MSGYNEDSPLNDRDSFLKGKINKSKWLLKQCPLYQLRIKERLRGVKMGFAVNSMHGALHKIIAYCENLL